MEGTAYEEEAPFHVDLIFKKESEARALADELQRWTPTGGWSDNAEFLFRLLQSR